MAKKTDTKKPVTTAKSATPKLAPVSSKKPRRVKRPTYQNFKLQKRIKHHVTLPSVYKLVKASAKTFWQNKGLFAGITLIYAVLNVVLVRGLSSFSSLNEAKDSLTNGLDSLSATFSTFFLFLDSVGRASSESGGIYQLFVTLIGSLAFIWALRQVVSGHKLRVKDAYYKGLYPLVPFILVLAVIGLQLIPLLIGSTMYNLVVSNGIAILAVERLLWALLYALLALLSLYMISSSVFALYIVTLPDMTPVKALRSARELVRYRRWTVLRKLIFLPFFLIALSAVVMVPTIFLLSGIAQWIFFLLVMFMLPMVHTYIYILYRELLNE